MLTARSENWSKNHFFGTQGTLIRAFMSYENLKMADLTIKREINIKLINGKKKK